MHQLDPGDGEPPTEEHQESRVAPGKGASSRPIAEVTATPLARSVVEGISDTPQPERDLQHEQNRLSQQQQQQNRQNAEHHHISERAVSLLQAMAQLSRDQSVGSHERTVRPFLASVASASVPGVGFSGPPGWPPFIPAPERDKSHLFAPTHSGGWPLGGEFAPPEVCASVGFVPSVPSVPSFLGQGREGPGIIPPAFQYVDPPRFTGYHRDEPGGWTSPAGPPTGQCEPRRVTPWVTSAPDNGDNGERPADDGPRRDDTSERGNAVWTARRTEAQGYGCTCAPTRRFLSIAPDSLRTTRELAVRVLCREGSSHARGRGSIAWDGVDVVRTLCWSENMRSVIDARGRRWSEYHPPGDEDRCSPIYSEDLGGGAKRYLSIRSVFPALRTCACGGRGRAPGRSPSASDSGGDAGKVRGRRQPRRRSGSRE